MTIIDAQRIARLRKGQCLSRVYKNNRTKLRWRCQRGHTWKAALDHVKGSERRTGTWCPICAGTRKKTIAEFQSIAKAKGGKCLSKQYVNINGKLRWKCEAGHIWSTTPRKIILGRWCPICGVEKRSKGRRTTIEEIRELCRKRGGRCLSSEYKSGHQKLAIECAKGHRWKTRLSLIKRGTWCKKCHDKNVAGRYHQLSLLDLKKVAKIRGGKCLSSKYVNVHTKLTWQCSQKHKWKASASSVKTGSWCPTCSGRINERICRTFFEQIFNAPFPATWPSWLTNRDGNRMELDGYNRNLGLAFEHHGEQHYSTRTHFITSRDTLLRRKRDDRRKLYLCKKFDVKLIVIPELGPRLPLERLQDYIFDRLKHKGVEIQKKWAKTKVDLSGIYLPDLLSQYAEIAEGKGGKCLSREYLGAARKLWWKCDKGHIWQTTPNAIKGGTWCPRCRKKEAGDKLRHSIATCNEVAEGMGGRCLEKDYTNNRKKITWQCDKGHIWKASFGKVQAGSWCPKCSNRDRANNRRTPIAIINEIAESRGGQCLSPDYSRAGQKLILECSKGHRWRSSVSVLKRGGWCRKCYDSSVADRVRKYDISQMQTLANKRGGSCLSIAYNDTKSKLRWQCGCGNEWMASADKIIQGQWCPECAALKKGTSQKLGLQYARLLAARYGGFCLSNEYSNSKSKLSWKCKKGHVWESSIQTINRRQTWCPTCRGWRASININDMKEMSATRGGECLSRKYTNAKTKLKWRCKEGHIWWAIPDNVRRGTWCPKCQKNR